MTEIAERARAKLRRDRALPKLVQPTTLTATADPKRESPTADIEDPRRA
jgi:hypothetical protein